MTVKLLTEQHLDVLSLKAGCTGLSESTLVKMPHCWESHVTAQLYYLASVGLCKLMYTETFFYLKWFSPCFVKRGFIFAPTLLANKCSMSYNSIVYIYSKHFMQK